MKDNESEIDPLGLDVYATVDSLITQTCDVVNKFARTIGCHLPSGMAKPSAIAAIQKFIMQAKGIDQAEFNKFFPSWKKTTGGIMALLCPHAIVYYFKSLIGGEGPSDAADAMLTVKAKIYVYDAIGSVVGHMKNRDAEFFGPNKGLPISNSKANIDHVKNQSLPWLLDLKHL
jgi:hypothetical protein